jgi:hypothetical protein
VPFHLPLPVSRSPSVASPWCLPLEPRENLNKPSTLLDFS